MRRLAPLLWVGMAAVVACGSHPPNRLVLHFDASAGGDGGTTDAATDDSGDDGGAVDPTLGGPCVDDAQCDDSIACTYDSCDGSVGRCRNVPDDAQCDDGVFCDGKERCVLRHGCQPGPVETCEDGNECTIDTCVEATKSCSNTPRDEDGDGDPDAHCVPHRDCNDLDPTVSSQHAEVCANGKDDNCNGQVDEQPCVTAPGDGCMTTVPLGGPGTYALSTLGCDKTFTTSCSVSKPQAASDVVSSVVVPPGPNVDLEVWATSSVEVAVAIDASCGQASSELACGSGPGATSVRARARNVAPGTYFVVATTASQTSDVTLAVQFLTPSSPPTNVDCASAIPLAPNTPTTVSIVDPPTRLASACPASTGALTYSLALSAPSDVTLYASTLRGSGTAVLGLRVPHCTDMGDELRCSAGDAPSLYARALAPGTYVVTVAATSPIDVSVQAALSPPTPAPPDQTCSGSPSLAPGGSLAFDLAAHEGDIRDGCATGGPDAAYDLALPSASDVLLVERIPQVESGAVSLDAPACGKADRLVCATGGTPIRVGKRNVGQGDYRVVVSDTLGLKGTVEALVRPTVPPTILPSGAADTCATAIDASSGGYFTGDTSTTQPTYSSGCDSPDSPGAPDQVLSLSLTQAQRLVIDMEGSTYTTMLDIHQGPSCPGTPVPNACYVGFGMARSFLDLELQAGQYWVIIAGYSGAKGPWSADVRVLPP